MKYQYPSHSPIKRRGTKIRCEICGNYYSNLSFHIKVHGISVREYRIAYNIPMSLSLLNELTRKKKREQAIENKILKRMPYRPSFPKGKDNPIYEWKKSERFEAMKGQVVEKWGMTFSKYTLIRRMGLIPVKKVAELMGVTEKTIRKWDEQGILKPNVYYGKSKSRFYDKDKVIEYRKLYQGRGIESKEERVDHNREYLTSNGDDYDVQPSVEKSRKENS